MTLIWGSPQPGPIRIVGVRLGYPRNGSSPWRSISSLLQFLDRDDEPRGPRNRVDAALRHCPVRHRSAQSNLHPERALLLYAELVLLGLADNSGVHSIGMASLDERLDPGHHPLLVHGVTEYQAAGERDTGVPYSTHGHHGRRQVPLSVARPAPVDTPSISLGPKG